MIQKSKTFLMLACATAVVLFFGFAGNLMLDFPVFSNVQNFKFYQAQQNNSDHGNPFDDLSSRLEFIGYLLLFFCVSVSISLLIISIATIGIFVRLGKIRKELSLLNRSRQQSVRYVQPQIAQPQQSQQLRSQQSKQS